MLIFRNCFALARSLVMFHNHFHIQVYYFYLFLLIYQNTSNTSTSNTIKQHHIPQLLRPFQSSLGPFTDVAVTSGRLF